ncbi:MAG: DUF1638 domain-containing protein [Methanomassiliicoccales archaeon]|nr:DUF1638 domain-containing protein [Methanomassiliicoccales archaeon]NYT15855.1 DUF1638 domain-containing protein [Methanomassiliicoccales archaeon]
MEENGTLAIIGCLLMEDEMVHVITHDSSIKSVLVIENEVNDSILSKLNDGLEGVPIGLLNEDELQSLPKNDGFSILVWMKDMALHESPEILKKDMIETIRKLRGTCDAAMLFYGLCGNALKDIGGLSKEAGMPVTILRDSRGEIVDDCIAAVIGGREAYQKIVSRDLGVFFLTPMWAEVWREMAVRTRVVPPGYDISLYKMVLQSSGYTKVIKIDTGLNDAEKFEDQAVEFAEIFELEKVDMNGDLDLVKESYEKAKATIKDEVST